MRARTNPPRSIHPRRFTGARRSLGVLLGVLTGLVVSVAPPALATGAAAGSSPQAFRPVVSGVPSRATALGPMLFIGDSVGASIKWTLTPLLKAGNYTHHVDAVSGRCTLRTKNRCARGDAWDVIDNLDSSFKPTFAVVELGYNDTRAALTEGIDALMNDLIDLGVKRVYWINLSERRPTRTGSLYAPANDILAKAARKWAQLTILDWNSASSGSSKTGWFIQGSSGRPDLIHLTTTGQKQFAQWIRAELDRLRADGHLPGSEAPASARPDLRAGDSGAAVADLQQALVDGGANIRVDGEFGPKTERAVKAFQRANGLRPDGWVGKKTWKKLGF